MRRRLQELFVFGCVVSLAAAGRLTLRLIAGAMIAWAAVPLAEAAVGAIARSREPVHAFGRPVLAWLVLVAAVVSFLTPIQAEALSANDVLVLSAGAITLVLGVVPGPRETLKLRAMVWALVLVWVFAFAAWPIVADPLGL